ncbi:MAG: metal ABC transporter permease [Planctomycetota bacterium]
MMPLSLYAVTLSWALDGWIIVIGILASVACALLGNFLVLRRMSMLGDAMTHAVLPGIAIAFILSQSRSSPLMFLGAVIVGALTAFFTEWLRGVGKVDEGASMGVVFTTLFAIGLVMMVQAADRIDLDPNCVLYGAMEPAALDRISIGGFRVPRSIVVLSIVAGVNLVFVILCFKELCLTSFDPSLATTMGFSANRMHYFLMILVSVTAVACFESVGSILVVAMFIVPGATAYLLTDRLSWMIGLSILLGASSALFGHLSAVFVPSWFGYSSTTTASMIAVVGGCFFGAAATLSPSHGIVTKWTRRQLLSFQILCDDVVASLFRGEESGRDHANHTGLGKSLLAGPVAIRFSVWWLRRTGDIEDGALIKLTDQGRERGKQLVRSHRLWEQYLVDQAGLETDRIHGSAERFEHFTDRAMREQLSEQTDAPNNDPHGKPIPEEFN